MLTTKKWAKPRTGDAWVIFGLLAVLLIPAALTLRTVQVSLIEGAVSYSTPLGYTWSLTLFGLPLAVILISLMRNPQARIPRKSFFLTLAIMLPIAFFLDLALANTIFTFPNEEATLGLKIWGLEFDPLAVRQNLPIEEFIFYILGITVSLAAYLWLSEVWFRRYSKGSVAECVDQGKEYRDEELLRNIHLFSLSARPLLIAIGLASAAFAYKKFGSHEHKEGFPLYFFYLLCVAFVPAWLFFKAVSPFINWRAMTFSMLAMLLVSLFWEACLAIPFGWWGYQSKYMLGLFILQWTGSGFGGPGLPVEAVLVWIQVTFSMVIVYEVIRIMILRRDASKRGLLLKDVLTKRSPVVAAVTEEHREEVYRHRYAVYATELKQNLEAMDHERLRMAAPEDAWSETHLFTVKDKGEIRASIRLITGSDRIRHHAAFDVFELERFSPFPIESLWFTQDLVASAGPWESLRTASLIFHTYRFARSRGGLFGFCLSDVARVPHYQRLGYRLFSRNFQDSDKGLKIPMVLVGPDLAYLEKITSPLASVAGEFEPNKAAVEWFHEMFSRPDEPAVDATLAPSRLAIFEPLNEAAAGHEWRLDDEELEDLREKGCLLRLDAGDVLIESGAVETELYIVVSGLLVAYSHKESSVPIGWSGPGGVLGEMAYLLGDNIRTATVRAVLPSLVVLVGRQSLQQWLETSPALSAKFHHRIASSLAQRLRDQQLA
ncbi:MAG: Crp/Fnr family transcriptional regulator [Verrucomicrobiales bacterium]